MRIYECDQRGDEWRRLRLGIPTASRFDKIVTPSGAPSTQADTYLYQLLSEWITGKPHDDYINPWMQRGVEKEEEARNYYCFEREVEPRIVGFCTTDDGMAGCSPDLLVDPDGGCEIKVPSPGVHVQYMIENRLPPKYVPQVQGSIWVTERDWWDWLSYNEDLPPVIIRVHRDDKFIKALEAQLRRFNAQLQGCKEQLIERGYGPKLEAAA